MDRNERLDVMVAMIRDRPGINARALGRACKVSIRTVLRDVAYLRRRGWPIDSDVGPGGGLRLPPRWGLGRVHFTPEQGLCVLVALAVSEKLDFPLFSREFPRARRLLVGAYPGEERRVVSWLQERIFVGSPASEAVRRSYRRPERTLMDKVQAAFVRELGIRVRYENSEGRLTSRVIEPHVLSIRWPAWYLLALDCRRDEPRMFRIDRFRTVELLESHRFRAQPDRMLEAIDAFPGTPLR